MSKHDGKLPLFDDQGRNIVDPKDSLGLKTAYISTLHALALERYVGRGSGVAVDVGCGYGRVTECMTVLGWNVLGVDPSLRVLRSAASFFSRGAWCAGALPDLPVRPASVDLVLAQNLLRVLHLNGILHAAIALASMIKPGGRLVIVDNIREGHPEFVSEDWITETFVAEGLKLARRVAIRAARWPPIYAVRYGLVPKRLHRRLAEWELSRMAQAVRRPRHQYHNVMFIFERPQ